MARGAAETMALMVVKTEAAAAVVTEASLAVAATVTANKMEMTIFCKLLEGAMPTGLEPTKGR